MWGHVPVSAEYVSDIGPMVTWLAFTVRALGGNSCLLTWGRTPGLREISVNTPFMNNDLDVPWRIGDQSELEFVGPLNEIEQVSVVAVREPRVPVHCLLIGHVQTVLLQICQQQCAGAIAIRIRVTIQVQRDSYPSSTRAVILSASVPCPLKAKDNTQLSISIGLSVTIPVAITLPCPLGKWITKIRPYY